MFGSRQGFPAELRFLPYIHAMLLRVTLASAGLSCLLTCAVYNKYTYLLTSLSLSLRRLTQKPAPPQRCGTYSVMFHFDGLAPLCTSSLRRL